MQRRYRYIVVFLALAVLLTGLGYTLYAAPKQPAAKQSAPKQPVAKAGQASEKAPAPKPAEKGITHVASLFDDGKARHFQYKTADGATIPYFVIKSSDGVIRAAFDACDVCFEARKGYEQDGDFMVCQNCGKRFKSTRINEVQGGCNPAPLTRKVENGKVIVAAKDFDEGKQYFASRRY